MKHALLLSSLILFVSCGQSPATLSSSPTTLTSSTELSSATPPGSYIKDTHLASRTSKVCWRKGDKRAPDAMQIVQDIVTAEYAKADIHFEFWKECPDGATNKDFVIIAVVDAGPYTLYGCQSSKDFCVRLNFDFVRWPGQCDRADWNNTWGCYCTQQEHYKTCLQDYALHEFGHAVGLLHEADRPDATCKDKTGRDTDAIDVGPYDPTSIMNYCNNKKQIIGKLTPTLSSGDLETIAKIYDSIL